jgi:hypothetical protein
MSADLKAPAHVLIAGAGSELGDGFLRSAASRAYALVAQHPERRVLVLVPIEPLTNLDKAAQARLAEKGILAGDRERKWVAASGLAVIAESEATLNPAEALRVAAEVARLQSLELFTHASWPSGASLESSAFANRFAFAKPQLNAYAGQPVDVSVLTPGLEALRPKLADDAFVVFWGCNTGYTIAPMISAALGVPAFGSLTFTDFERLHKDGRYYKEESKFPQAEIYGPSPWAASDTLAHKSVACSKACRRMKPNNVPYNGAWGNYDRVNEMFSPTPWPPPTPSPTPQVVSADPSATPSPTPTVPPVPRQFHGGGLGFYKAFCNFPESQPGDRSRCLRGMGAFMMGTISTVPMRDVSFRAYKHRVLDFLCPRERGEGEFVECAARLEEMEKKPAAYSSFRGNAIECNSSFCDVVFDYYPGDAYGIDQKSVRLDAEYNKAPQTQVKEYLDYLRAYTVYTKKKAPAVKLSRDLERAFKKSQKEELAAAAKHSHRKPASAYQPEHPGPVDDVADPAWQRR